MHCSPAACFSSPDPHAPVKKKKRKEISNFFPLHDEKLPVLLSLMPKSFVHLLFLLVVATGIPLSTVKVPMSQQGLLSPKLNAGQCPKT